MSASTVLAVWVSSLLCYYLGGFAAWASFALCGAAYVTGGSPSQFKRSVSRVKTAFTSIKALYQLSPEQVDDFIRSYELFDKEVVGGGDDEHIKNYYGVLNHLCSIGEVEKMYIPPLLDPTQSIIDNQLLFEAKMMRDLGITKDSHVLDVGCGRGLVLTNVATSTGASQLRGLNIDSVQLGIAKAAKELHGLNQIQYTQGDFNDPLPYPDNSFDALYQIQVITYAKDKKALFSEMFRVLKPGGRLSFLDWVKFDNYDEKSDHHQKIMKQVKPLIGAVDIPTGLELKQVLESVGFEVTYSDNVSKGGLQADLIESADNFFRFFTWVINTSVAFNIIPSHFKVLFDRLVLGGGAFIEGDRLGLFTTSFQTLATKPKSVK